jgi:hypothetical protein
MLTTHFSGSLQLWRKRRHSRWGAQHTDTAGTFEHGSSPARWTYAPSLVSTLHSSLLKKIAPLDSRKQHRLWVTVTELISLPYLGNSTGAPRAATGGFETRKTRRGKHAQSPAEISKPGTKGTERCPVFPRTRTCCGHRVVAER